MSFIYFYITGVKTRPLCTLGKYSTTELHLQSSFSSYFETGLHRVAQADLEPL